MHPDIAPLAFLLGVWEGDGEGSYPTSSSFTYHERLTFEHVDDAFVLYTQESWTPEGEPLHFERGVLRPGGPGRVELTLAHPNGLTEVSEGTMEGRSLELASTSIGRSETGSAVSELARRYRVEDDVLSYELDMATEDVPLTFHVRASLKKA